jgi:hypothetical protein
MRILKLLIFMARLGSERSPGLVDIPQDTVRWVAIL